MKITPEQIAALQLQQKNTARSTSGEGFAQALTQEMNSGSSVQAASTASPVVPMVGLDQLLQTTMRQQPTEQTVMEKMDTLLSKWENYSQTLGTEEGSLREGYHLLNDIRQNIQEVKGDLAQAPAVGQGLKTMIEELDILTTTEEFKFNRGDYLN